MVADEFLAAIFTNANFRYRKEFFGAAFLKIKSASDIDKCRGDINVGNHRIGHDAFFLSRHFDDERDVQARLVNGGFGPRDCHAVISGENDHGVIVLTVLLERGDEQTECLVRAGAAVVLLRNLTACLDGVGQEGGDIHLGGVVGHLIGARVFFSNRWVAKSVRFKFLGHILDGAATSMRIHGCKVEEEGFVRFFIEQWFAGFDPRRGILAAWMA